MKVKTEELKKALLKLGDIDLDILSKIIDDVERFDNVVQKYIEAQEAYEKEWLKDDDDDVMPLNLAAEKVNEAWQELKKLKH